MPTGMVAKDAQRDPWTLLLEPALRRDRPAVLEAHTRLWRDLPPTARPVLEAVSARALAALGLLREAHGALDRGLSLDSPHAHTAARIARPGGPKRVTRLPGDTADLLCEQAQAALDAGSASGALTATEAALRIVPGHAEALRWQRSLTAPVQTDAEALRLAPQWGWLSPERWRRRVASGAWWPASRSGSGLERLRTEGVTTRILGTDTDHERASADHPLVDAEATLDLAMSLDREGRPAGRAALRAWQLASATDTLAQRDAAGALVALGVRNEDAAATGLLAVGLLKATEPGTALWCAYEASLLAGLDEPGAAQRIATRVLRDGGEDPVSFVLCIGALRRSGAPRAARTLAIRGLCCDVLKPTARVLLHDWNRCGPLLPQVSHRLVSRQHDLELEKPAG